MAEKDFRLTDFAEVTYNLRRLLQVSLFCLAATIVYRGCLCLTPANILQNFSVSESSRRNMGMAAKSTAAKSTKTTAAKAAPAKTAAKPAAPKSTKAKTGAAKSTKAKTGAAKATKAPVAKKPAAKK